MSASRPLIQGVDHEEQWHFQTAEGADRDLTGASFEYYLKTRGGETLLTDETSGVSLTATGGVVTRTISAAASTGIKTGYHQQQVKAIVGGKTYSLGLQEIEVKAGY